MRGGLILLWQVFIISIAAAHAGDKTYPPDYFRQPVEGQILLSGTFGELRGNHFHSGIDIKGYRGRKIVAAGPGHIALIRVDAGGYGNVLYVEHPNGYTSVYAHLNRFPDAVAELVHRVQHERKQFEVEIRLDSTAFPLEKGDYLGEMGNSGYSFGPHLHFEIRDSESGKPINPLLFGIKVADQLPPMITQLRLYGLDERNLDTYHETMPTRALGRGRYRIDADTLLIRSSRLGVAIKAFDKLDGARNWNGVYQIDMQVDGQNYFHFEVDEFAFAEWRYLNAHVDYADAMQKNSYYNRCFRLPGNQFSGIETPAHNGIIELTPGQAKRVIVKATDVAGNISSLAFWVKRDAETEVQAYSHDYYLPYEQANQINNYYLSLYFPEGSLYRDLPLEYHFEQEPSPEHFSPVHAIHHQEAPLHRPFTIRLRPHLIPKGLRAKAYVARCTEDNTVINCGGKWEGEFLTTQASGFGDFSIRTDTVPPRITAENFRYDLRGRQRISFKAEDDLRTGGTARGLRYRATIDGEWVLLSYDLKYDRFSYQFPSDGPRGEQVFRLEITDDRGNTAVFEEKFLR